MRLPGCAAVASSLGASAAGTAAFMRFWLLIEQPGPWGDDALERVLEQTGLRPEPGLRVLLVRSPGRHTRRDGRRMVFAGCGDPGNRWLERFEIDDLSELAGFEPRPGVGTPVDGPLFLVCTHGAKDMCCALLGRPLATALDGYFPDRTWEVSHVGGDRWAGNLLVVPDGYLYGQLGPEDGVQVAKAALDGHVVPERLRGRTTAPSHWVQHAEIVVRQRFRLHGLDDVFAVHEYRLDHDAHLVTVRAGARLVEATVRHRPSDHKAPSRCRSLVGPSGYEVTELTLVGSATSLLA